jgi:hypothetical protein
VYFFGEWNYAWLQPDKIRPYLDYRDELADRCHTAVFKESVSEADEASRYHATRSGSSRAARQADAWEDADEELQDILDNGMCTQCGTDERDDLLLFCERCRMYYHTYCHQPRIATLPPEEEDWFCIACQPDKYAPAGAGAAMEPLAKGQVCPSAERFFHGQARKSSSSSSSSSSSASRKRTTAAQVDDEPGAAATARAPQPPRKLPRNFKSLLTHTALPPPRSLPPRRDWSTARGRPSQTSGWLRFETARTTSSTASGPSDAFCHE